MMNEYAGSHWWLATFNHQVGETVQGIKDRHPEGIDFFLECVILTTICHVTPKDVCADLLKHEREFYTTTN